MSGAEYLSLLDWTGRQVVAGKRGSIPAHLAPILQRLGLDDESWLELAAGFGKLFHRVAGRVQSLPRVTPSGLPRRFRARHASLLEPPISRTAMA